MGKKIEKAKAGLTRVGAYLIDVGPSPKNIPGRTVGVIVEVQKSVRKKGDLLKEIWTLSRGQALVPEKVVFA